MEGWQVMADSYWGQTWTANGKTYTNASGLTDEDIGGLVTIRKDNTEAVLDAKNKAIAKALEEMGLTCEGYAKLLCPVDTGRLRNSITYLVRPSQKVVYIGTNVEYAACVELGTSRGQRPQPYLRPAAADHAAKYRQILKNNLESA